jgi:hypothetical protein
MKKGKPRVRTTTIRENLPEREEEEREDLADRAINDDIGEEAYSQFVTRFRGGQGCRIKVHRQTPRGKQYCFSGTPEEIDSEETIRLYHAQQPYSHEEGNYVLSVEVNGEFRSAFSVQVAPQVGTPGTERPSASGGMADVVRELQAQNRRLEDMLFRGGQDKPQMLELVEGLSRLDALRGGSGGGGNLETITKCIEIGMKMNGGGSSGDGGWEGMLREVLKDNAPALIGLFQAISKRISEPSAPGVAPQQPATVTGEPHMEAMQPAQAEMAILQQAIAYLKKKAMSQSDPGLYIDLIIDNREDPLYARLISQIVENDFPAFAKLDPEIGNAPYRDFFSTIHNGIRSVFRPTSAVATDTGGKGGNKADASGNGTTGKSGGK